MKSLSPHTAPLFLENKASAVSDLLFLGRMDVLRVRLDFFAAPESLYGRKPYWTQSFSRTARYIAKREIHGFKGFEPLNYDEYQEDLANALYNGTAHGKWHIPSLGVLRGVDGFSTVVRTLRYNIIETTDEQQSPPRMQLREIIVPPEMQRPFRLKRMSLTEEMVRQSRGRMIFGIEPDLNTSAQGRSVFAFHQNRAFEKDASLLQIGNLELQNVVSCTPASDNKLYGTQFNDHGKICEISPDDNVNAWLVMAVPVGKSPNDYRSPSYPSPV